MCTGAVDSEGGLIYGKGKFFGISLLAKKDLISGDVLNPESGGIASSHNDGFKRKLSFQKVKI